jgi:hypothetical protein
MSEPVSTVAAYFSLAKVWSIAAGVCGSIIPILALADKRKITMINAFFMALTGSSFSIFVGPALAMRIDLTSLDGIVALSWVLGAIGVFVVRAILNWLENRGEKTIDKVVERIIGNIDSRPTDISQQPGGRNDESIK